MMDGSASGGGCQRLRGEWQGMGATAGVQRGQMVC